MSVNVAYATGSLPDGHAICLQCWHTKLRRTRPPHRAPSLDPRPCCACGKETPAGVRLSASKANEHLWENCSCPTHITLSKPEKD